MYVFDSYISQIRNQTQKIIEKETTVDHLILSVIVSLGFRYATVSRGFYAINKVFYRGFYAINKVIIIIFLESKDS